MEKNAQEDASQKEQEKQNPRKPKLDHPYSPRPRVYLALSLVGVGVCLCVLSFSFTYQTIQDPRLMKITEDLRLKLFKKEWFDGRDCLDIGLCNNGTLTIYIAHEFCCRSILGIDIDSGRVKDANLNLHRTFSQLALVQSPVKPSTLKDSVGASSNEMIPMGSSPLKFTKDLSGIVAFSQHNFYESQYPLEKHYDTIVCLSATHWKDVGAGNLVTLFQKIWNLLRPNGILVLEPKSLESYGSNFYYVSQTTTRNILPEVFLKTLVDEIGFKAVEQFDYCRLDLINSKRETILVFKK
ncbi:hypothetical protein RIF29_42517 [Crotalaria pallida]|uniref:RNA methyltransferase n=1 Tax=Crotalaria pallida TaxID=3830 RepID=A0AAN9ECY3_CROPI